LTSVSNIFILLVCQKYTSAGRPNQPIILAKSMFCTILL